MKENTKEWCWYWVKKTLSYPRFILNEHFSHSLLATESKYTSTSKKRLLSNSTRGTTSSDALNIQSQPVIQLFVCCIIPDPRKSFSLICRCHHFRWSDAHIDLRLALMACYQWEFLTVPHLLWHVTSVFRVISDTHDIQPCCQGFGTCFLELCALQLGFNHPTFNILTNCITAAA